MVCIQEKAEKNVTKVGSWWPSYQKILSGEASQTLFYYYYGYEFISLHFCAGYNGEQERSGLNWTGNSPFSLS